MARLRRRARLDLAADHVPGVERQGDRGVGGGGCRHPPPLLARPLPCGATASRRTLSIQFHSDKCHVPPPAPPASPPLPPSAPPAAPPPAAPPLPPLTPANVRELRQRAAAGSACGRSRTPPSVRRRTMLRTAGLGRASAPPSTSRAAISRCARSPLGVPAPRRGRRPSAAPRPGSTTATTSMARRRCTKEECYCAPPPPPPPAPPPSCRRRRRRRARRRRRRRRCRRRRRRRRARRRRAAAASSAAAVGAAAATAAAFGAALPLPDPPPPPPMPPTCTYTLAADSAEAGALGASDDYCVPDTKEACEVAAKAAGLLVGCSVAAGCANDIAFSSASWPIKGCFAYPAGNDAATPLRGAAYFSPGTSEEKTQSVDGWEAPRPPAGPRLPLGIRHLGHLHRRRRVPARASGTAVVAAGAVDAAVAAAAAAAVRPAQREHPGEHVSRGCPQHRADWTALEGSWRSVTNVYTAAVVTADGLSDFSYSCDAHYPSPMADARSRRRAGTSAGPRGRGWRRRRRAAARAARRTPGGFRRAARPSARSDGGDGVLRRRSRRVQGLLPPDRGARVRVLVRRRRDATYSYKRRRRRAAARPTAAPTSRWNHRRRRRRRRRRRCRRSRACRRRRRCRSRRSTRPAAGAAVGATRLAFVLRVGPGEADRLRQPVRVRAHGGARGRRRDAHHKSAALCGRGDLRGQRLLRVRAAGAAADVADGHVGV